MELDFKNLLITHLIAAEALPYYVAKSKCLTILQDVLLSGLLLKVLQVSKHSSSNGGNEI